MGEFLVVTTETIPGRVIIAVHGLVHGSCVQAHPVGHDPAAPPRNVMRGELHESTERMNEARAKAIGRMIDEAHVLGANAVVGLRLTVAAVADGAVEVAAYGTAVTLR